MSEPARARELQEDLGQAIWVARLRSGKVAYMDDGPLETPPSAWLRLGRRLQEEGDAITSLSLKFRSHVESPLPEGSSGYFFSHSVHADVGGGQSRCLLIGHVEGQEVVIHHYLSPELALMQSERRPLASLEGSPCLIRS